MYGTPFKQRKHPACLALTVADIAPRCCLPYACHRPPSPAAWQQGRPGCSGAAGPCGGGQRGAAAGCRPLPAHGARQGAAHRAATALPAGLRAAPGSGQGGVWGLQCPAATALPGAGVGGPHTVCSDCTPQCHVGGCLCGLQHLGALPMLLPDSTYSPLFDSLAGPCMRSHKLRASTSQCCLPGHARR